MLKNPSMKVVDIVSTIEPSASLKIIRIRPGEKLHEEMISKSGSPYTYEYDDYYKILPAINNWNKDKSRLKKVG